METKVIAELPTKDGQYAAMWRQIDGTTYAETIQVRNGRVLLYSNLMDTWGFHEPSDVGVEDNTLESMYEFAIENDYPLYFIQLGDE